MPGKRVTWLDTGGDAQVVPRGTRCAAYSFRLEGASDAIPTAGQQPEAQWKTGGSSGTILEQLLCGDGNTIIDDLGGCGNWIEFPDGVYVEVAGNAILASILIVENEDP